jgi:hypothetical protein
MKNPVIRKSFVILSAVSAAQSAALTESKDPDAASAKMNVKGSSHDAAR